MDRELATRIADALEGILKELGEIKDLLPKGRKEKKEETKE